MKNFFLAFILLCGCMLGMTGCGSKEMKDVKGQVLSVKAVHDTLFSAKVLIDGDTAVFKLTDARFINGLFVSGDSIKVTYIEGRNDTLRALIVSIIPKAPHLIDPEAIKNDSLITAPAKE